MGQWKSCPSGLINMQRKNILTRATRVHSQREKEKKKEKEQRELWREGSLENMVFESYNLRYNTVGQWVNGRVVTSSEGMVLIQHAGEEHIDKSNTSS